nr:hypothetical protein CFP56_76036 [Quercus suber]
MKKSPLPRREGGGLDYFAYIGFVDSSIYRTAKTGPISRSLNQGVKRSPRPAPQADNIHQTGDDTRTRVSLFSCPGDGTMINRARFNTGSKEGSAETPVRPLDLGSS